LRPVLGSAGDERLLARLFAEEAVDYVFHAAAYKHVPIVEANPRCGLMNNALATHTLAAAVRQSDVPAFVLVSSDKAESPVGVMGASKRLAEIFVQDVASRSRRTQFSLVRFGNVAGSSGSVLPLFQSQIRRGGPITLTDRTATRYFMSQDAATALILTAATRAGQGELLTHDMGRPVRILDLACGMIRDAGLIPRPPGATDGDIEIREIGLRPGERLHEIAAPAGGEPLEPASPIRRHRLHCPAPLAVAALLRDLREAVATDDEAMLRGIVARVAALDRKGTAPGIAAPGSRGTA
jgi:FlaA1/EpsC-like NDP-sugar epimerase